MSDAILRSYPVIAVGAPRDEAPEPVIDLSRSELEAPFDPRLVLLVEPESARANAFRLLRHRLLGDGDPRVVAVTSARAAEGKTTCAANLALAIAEEASKTVLLLDANPLNPALAELLQIQDAKLVLERAANREYPVYAPAQRLRVALLFAGREPGTSLDRAKLGSALADFRDSYDYVVIDAASALESVTVNVLAELADGVIVAARARVSERRSLRRALEELVPARVLGAVLLDV
jgi:Mrp family chromosome partitioning ATPase